MKRMTRYRSGMVFPAGFYERLPSSLHTWGLILDSIKRNALRAIQALFNKNGARVARREWIYALLVAAFFVLLLPILLSKSIGRMEGDADFYFFQAFNDYDIDWGTPIFALAGNLLFNFGVQFPLKTSLSPILGLAHRLSPTYQIVIALTLYSAAFAVLLWNIGRDLGLRPVPRMIFAGLAAMIVSVPNGLNKIIFIVPSLYLTPLVCGLWWGETALLSVTAAYLFFRLGQRPSRFQNIVIGIAFSFVCWIVLLAFSHGSVFIVPVILFYCIAFLVTARARELLWKASVGGVLAAVMLLTHVPDYFQQLYSYTYGAYFTEALYTRDVDFMTLLKHSTMATAMSYEIRVPFFVIVSLGTTCFCVLRSTGALKRIAAAVLFTEVCIVLLGCINALTFRYPISLLYSEFMHEAFLAGYFVLFLSSFPLYLVLQSTRSFEKFRLCEGRGFCGMGCRKPAKASTFRYLHSGFVESARDAGFRWLA